MAQSASTARSIKSVISNSNQALPRLLFTEELSAVTGLSITTIRCYIGNAEKFGHLLPKWFKLPGKRRLAWFESDVLDWIRSAHQIAVPSKPRRKGRPIKAEQIAKERRDTNINVQRQMVK